MPLPATQPSSSLPVFTAPLLSTTASSSSSSSASHVLFANEYDRVILLLNTVDSLTTSLYHELSDAWLQSELFSFLHVKDELTTRVKRRQSSKAAGDKKKTLRVSALSSTAGPDVRSTEIASGHSVPDTPLHDGAVEMKGRTRLKTAAQQPAAAAAGKKKKLNTVLKELEQQEVVSGSSAETAAAAAALPTVQAEGNASEVKPESETEGAAALPLAVLAEVTASPASRVAARLASKGRAAFASPTASSSAASTASSSVLKPSLPRGKSGIPSVLPTSFAVRKDKKPGIPLQTKKVGKAAEETAVPDTARVLSAAHAELAMKLSDLQRQHVELTEKHDKFVKKREKQQEEEEEKKRQQQEEEEQAKERERLTKEAEEKERVAVVNSTDAAQAACSTAPQDEVAAVVQEATTVGAASSAALRPLSAAAAAPLLSSTTSSPRPVSPRQQALPPLSPLSSARRGGHHTALPPLLSTSRPVTPAPLPVSSLASVDSGLLSARDEIVQPVAYENNEAQRGVVCSGLHLMPSTPRLLLRPGSSELQQLSGIAAVSSLTSAAALEESKAEEERRQQSKKEQEMEAVAEAEAKATVQVAAAVLGRGSGSGNGDLPFSLRASHLVISRDSLMHAENQAKRQQQQQQGQGQEATQAMPTSPQLLLRPATSEVKARTEAATVQPVKEAEAEEAAAAPAAEMQSSSDSFTEAERVAGSAAPASCNTARRLQLRPSPAETEHNTQPSSPRTPSARRALAVHTTAASSSTSHLPPFSPSARSRATSSTSPSSHGADDVFPTLVVGGSRRCSEDATSSLTATPLSMLRETAVEAALEAAEERLKKERWRFVMKEVESRAARSTPRKQGAAGELTDEDEVAAAERRAARMRRLKDESLITANDLQRQMKRMGLAVEDEQLHGRQTVDDAAFCLPPLQPLAPDACDVPLPDSVRTDRTETQQSAVADAVDPCNVPLPDSSRTEGTERTPQQEQQQIADASVDACDVPLPESARTEAGDTADVAQIAAES